MKQKFKNIKEDIAILFVIILCIAILIAAVYIIYYIYYFSIEIWGAKNVIIFNICIVLFVIMLSWSINQLEK